MLPRGGEAVGQSQILPSGGESHAGPMLPAMVEAALDAPSETDYTQNMRAVNSMQPVAQISGQEFQKTGESLVDRVAAFFRSFGNMVHNNELGEIVVDKRGAKSSMGHGVGKIKAAALAAVPDVLINGKVIDYQTNWKGRNYDTAVVAAPVAIGGELYDMGVVVTKSDSDSRFYVHEILAQKKEQRAAFAQDGVAPKSGAPDSTPYPSITSLLEQMRNVNIESENTADTGPMLPAIAG